MKNPSVYQRFCFTFSFAALVVLCGSHGWAQELEESIENELDRVDSGKAQTAPPVEQNAVETPTAKPAPETSQAAAGADEPNYNLEKKLYEDSRRSQPVSSEKWTEMIGSRREDIYRVQKGDSLWDMSQTLFGDGFYWSKLWAENRDVENPHLILKGRNIRFVSGTEESAPSVGLVSDEAAGPPILVNALRESHGAAPIYRDQALKELSPQDLSNRNMVEVEELIPRPEMPPGRPSRPLLKQLPNSFEEPAKILNDKRYDITGLDAGSVRSLTVPATVFASSYLADAMPKSDGKIEEIEATEKTASIGQYVFVHTDQPTRIGQKFSVIIPRDKIKDPVLGSIGPVIEVGGVIEVTSVINQEKNQYRAAVIGNVNPIRVGSLLTQEPLPRANFARRGTLLNTEVRIIGGEFDEERRIIGESSIVYLDGGEDAGLTVGDILSIQARRSERREQSKFPNWTRPIGTLKVIKVNKTVATAVILEAQEEVRPGDRTGGQMPQQLPPLQQEVK